MVFVSFFGLNFLGPKKRNCSENRWSKSESKLNVGKKVHKKGQTSSTQGWLFILLLTRDQLRSTALLEESLINNITVSK